jgi:hypothetical protein
MTVRLKIAEFDIGARWTSGDRALHFSQTGNLELWDTASFSLLWESGTAHRGAKRLDMQRDGNLVLYDAQGAPVWDSTTSGNEGASLLLDEGGLTIVSARGVPLWRTPDVPKAEIAEPGAAPATIVPEESPPVGTGDVLAETGMANSPGAPLPSGVLAE